MQYGFEFARQRHEELLGRAAAARLAEQARPRRVRRGVAVALRQLADRLEQPELSPTAAA